MQQIVSTNEMFAKKAASLILAQARNCNVKDKIFRLALTGGKTPIEIFEEILAHQHKVDWSGVEVFWIDERCVPATSTDSNFGECDRKLIQKLIQKPKCYPIYFNGQAKKSSQEYEELLGHKFGSSLPRFDMALLGVGSDGHVASLFTREHVLDTSSWVLTTNSPNHPYERVSLSMQVINNARYKLFIVKGHEKEWVYNACIDGVNSDVPASYVSSNGDDTCWLTSF